MPNAVVFFRVAAAMTAVLRERLTASGEGTTDAAIESVDELQRCVARDGIAAVVTELDHGAIEDAFRAASPAGVPVIAVAKGDEEIDRVADAMREGAADVIGLRSERWARWPDVVAAARQTLVHGLLRRGALERVIERAIHAAPCGITIVDAQSPDYRTIYANAAFERMTGYRRDEIVGRNTRVLQRDDTDQPEIAEIGRALREQRDGRAVLRNYRKDGSLFWNEIVISPVRDDDGRVTHFVGLQNDISERKQLEFEQAQRGSHDSLTGLPDHPLAQDRIHQAIALARRSHRPIAVLFLDLDRFNTINESLGRDGGDAILRTIGDRLAAAARGGDTVARVGGDEFVLVCPELADDDEATAIASRIRSVVAEPISVDGEPMSLTASIGVAIYPKDAAAASELLKCANLAAARAKEQGPSRIEFFTSDLSERAMHRVALERELRVAVERADFELHFQPQVALESGRVTGLESLLRWRHPDRGLLLPSAFVPLAEETGLIVPIGRWVLREACAQAVALRDLGHPDLIVAVNVSAVQVRHGTLASDVLSALAETGLEPRRLEIELTESAIAESGERFANVLRELRDQGIRIAIDDFGTGYASLAYLKRFPIDLVKIDQSFVRDLVTEPEDAAIVQAVIAMAHRLDLGVIAEGVETEEQAAFLRRGRCDFAQGYLFGRPVAIGALGSLITQREREPRPAPPLGSNRRLLFVDDEESILRLLQRILRSEGYEIHTANTAERALQILAQTPIAVVVSDQRLPGMSGTEFLRRVRALYPETVRIVLSGYADLESVTSAINDGAIYKFLTKPWEEEALRFDLRQAFRLFDTKAAEGRTGAPA